MMADSKRSLRTWRQLLSVAGLKGQAGPKLDREHRSSISPGGASCGEVQLSVVRQARVYAEFVRVGFVNTLAYRLRYYTGIVTYFMYVSVYYFIWKAIFAHSSRIEG